MEKINTMYLTYLKRQFMRKLRVILLSLLFVTPCLYIVYNIITGPTWNQKQNGIRYIRQESDLRSSVRHLKSEPTVLFWTPYNVGEDPAACMKNCPFKCKITRDKNEIMNADVVNFYLTNLWSDNWNIGSKATIEFPTYRRADQVWAVTNMEPPANLFGDLRVFNGVFNWTIWHRKDADLYQPYGFTKPLSDSEIMKAENDLKHRNFYKEKTAGLAGMISNCVDFGHRYRLVDRMSKYLNIDMYGKCYNNVCGDPKNFQTCTNVIKTYKFYLSFENSRCKDYITEKYWHALVREQIPIVNWDFSHIDDSIPIPGSFISVSDFRNVEELAKYIDKVSNNETLYNSYFAWKKMYTIGYICTACLICGEIQKPIKPQTVVDLEGWVNDDVCEKVNNSNIRKLRQDHSLFMKFGT